MNLLDWAIVILYAAGLIWMGLWLRRSQESVHDYYLAGRGLRWWQSGLSTMATQLGAVSFVSAPAFVAIKPDGGLKWLCYEFAVPLAMILVMAVILPQFHRSGVLSIYEYLEKRFDGRVRTSVSLLFQVGRGLATGVAVLAGALIVSTALGISTAMAILFVGVVTVLYDMMGGMRGVVYSDVVQMAIIAAGVLVCAGVALSISGWEGAWNALGEDRLQVLDFRGTGLTDESQYAFWPMTVGGFFLYASYYGCDQSQAQRELAVGDLHDVRKSLLLNALGRFPLVLAYCLMGVFIGAIVLTPEFLERAADHFATTPEGVSDLLTRDPDRMVPMFILTYLPHGLIGFLIVAILSALMSSLDSSLNSLSASTMRDIYQRYLRPDASEAHYLRASRLTTGLWGVFSIASALIFDAGGEAARETTLVLINAIGSMLYGPILATFLLGMLTRRIGPRAAEWGLWSGVAVNLALWLGTDIAWVWWNFTGFAATIAAAFAVSLREGPAARFPKLAPPEQDRLPWPMIYIGLAFYFLLMVGLSAMIGG